MSEPVAPSDVLAASPGPTTKNTDAQSDRAVAGPGYNLKAVLQDCGQHNAPPPPTGHRQVVRLRGDAPVHTATAAPVGVAGFADGIQSDLVVCYVEHRPVTLVWVAAGAVDPTGNLLSIRQRMAVVASAQE